MSYEEHCKKYGHVLQAIRERAAAAKPGDVIYITDEERWQAVGCIPVGKIDSPDDAPIRHGFWIGDVQIVNTPDGKP